MYAVVAVAIIVIVVRRIEQCKQHFALFVGFFADVLKTLELHFEAIVFDDIRSLEQAFDANTPLVPDLLIFVPDLRILFEKRTLHGVEREVETVEV